MNSCPIGHRKSSPAMRAFNAIVAIFLIWVAVTVWHIARRDGTPYDAESWLIVLAIWNISSALGYTARAIAD